MAGQKENSQMSLLKEGLFFFVCVFSLGKNRKHHPTLLLLGPFASPRTRKRRLGPRHNGRLQGRDLVDATGMVGPQTGGAKKSQSQVGPVGCGQQCWLAVFFFGGGGG